LQYFICKFDYKRRAVSQSLNREQCIHFGPQRRHKLLSGLEGKTILVMNFASRALPSAERLRNNEAAHSRVVQVIWDPIESYFGPA
jgi:hypothetical protein